MEPFTIVMFVIGCVFTYGAVGSLIFRVCEKKNYDTESTFFCAILWPLSINFLLPRWGILWFEKWNHVRRERREVRKQAEAKAKEVLVTNGAYR